MKSDRRIVISIVWIVLGIALIGLSVEGVVDTFWNGMGSGVFVVGLLQVLRYFRFSKDPKYREKMEIEENDERNHFLRNKAWAWTGYLFVMIVAVACIVFKVIKQDVLFMAAMGAVSLMLILYWVTYFILRRRY